MKSITTNATVRALQGIVAVTVLFLGFACASQELRRSSAQEAKLSDDPVKSAQIHSLLEKGNLALVRRDYRTAEKNAKEANTIQPTFKAYYLLGMVYRDEGRNDDALQSLLQAEELAPNEEQLLLSIGLLYNAKGQTDQALQRFQRLLQIAPEDPVYNYRTGVIYKEKKDYEKALSHLKLADVDGFEYQDQALLQLGDVCLELRRFDEADQYFNRARGTNPKLQAALTGNDASQTARLLEKGNQYFKAKDYPLAEDAYRQAAQLSPKSPSPRIQLGTVFLAKGDKVSARSQFEEALKISPGSNEARIMLAATAREQADYDRSFKVIHEGLKLNPDDPELLNQLGLHYDAQGDRQKAVVSFESALSKDNDFIPARKNAIVQYIALGRFADARRHLNIVEKQDPKSAKEWQKTGQLIQIHEILERGHSLYGKGQYRKAEAEYTKALRIKKDYPQTLIAIGRSRLLNGNPRGAETAFRSARSIEPSNPEALEGLLAVYTKTGDWRAKNSLQNEIQRQGAANPEVLLALARTKEDEGRRAEAYRDYASLLKRLPDNAYIKRRMAGIKIQDAIAANSKNQFDEALTHLKEAQRIDPSHPALESNLQIVNDNRKYRHLIPDIERAEQSFRARRYKQAESQFNQLYKQWQRPAFLVRLAEIQFETGHEATGQSMLIEALKKNPAGIEYREALYSRLLDRRQLDEAEAGFKNIVAEDESAFFSLYKLGIIRMLKKQYKDALNFMQSALLYKPDFLPARIARGVVFYEQGNKTQARQEFEEARKVELHGQELALLNLALMDWNDGSQRTEKALNELVRLYPKFADPYYHLSYLHYASGRQSSALQNIDKALALQKTPEFLFAKIEILNKMKSGRALETAGREFLNSYPGDQHANQVRRILASAGGQKDYVEPAMRYPVGGDPVYAFSNSYLIVRQTMLLGVEKGTDRVLFQKPVQSLSQRLDGLMMILEKGTLRRFDPLTGEELLSIAVPESSCAVFGSAALPVVQLQCQPGKEATFQVAGSEYQYSAKPGSRLYSVDQDRFIVISNSEVVLLDSTLKQLQSKSLATGNWQVHETSGRKNLFLSTASMVQFLDADNLSMKEIPLKKGGRFVFNNQPLLIMGRQVHQLSEEDGSLVHEFTLPQEAEKADMTTVAVLSEDRIGFVNERNEWLLCDSKGKVILRENLSQTGAYAFRLYPVVAKE